MVLATVLSGPAPAAPLLQLYVEGATYNTETESWEISGFSDGSTFRLWAIGNVDGPGGKGDILAVRLSVAYEDDAEPVVLEITPTRAGGAGFFDGIVDQGTPDDAVFIQKVTDGSSPLLGDGRALPAHGIFGPGVYWQEFALGDFTATTDTVADFIGDFPSLSEMVQNSGQINAYDISLVSSATHPTNLHFDLYNHVEAKNHFMYKFAPFSHDGDADVHVVPEPASLTVWGLLGLLFGRCAWRRKRNRPFRTAT